MNGIRVEVTDEIKCGDFLIMYMELDIVEPAAGELNVSRKGLDLKDSILSLAVRRLDQEFRALIGANKGLFDNEYALLNLWVSWCFPPHFYWMFPAGPGAVTSDQVWTEIAFPALMGDGDLPKCVPKNPLLARPHAPL